MDGSCGHWMDQSETRGLLQIAQEELQAVRLPALQRLSVDIEGNSIVLSGRLTSFYQMQLAQEAVKRIDGVESIRNQIEVVDC